MALTPTKLAKACTDAGYFERNLRAIEVLIDQDTMKQAPAEGEFWRYYDLGHGLCAYEFFDQCAHRTACARCDFYRPRQSSLTQLLETKDNILRFLQEVSPHGRGARSRRRRPRRHQTSHNDARRPTDSVRPDPG